MRRIKPSYFLVAIIIIAIVGISIAIPVVYFSQSYSDVLVETGWVLAVSETPTQTVMASLTFEPRQSPTQTVSPSPAASSNCVYPSEYWEEHPELWLEMLVGNTMYSKDDIRLIFDDQSLEIYPVLLKQLYLANLNIYSGADSTSIESVLGEANTWLQTYLPGEPLPEEARLVGVQLAQTLAEFNIGLIGPGLCPPYEAQIVTPVIIDPTATPSPTATPTATRVFVTLQPTATATKKKEPDKKPEPTDPEEKPEPTDPPPPTKEPEPTDPPKPTEAPTSAPPEDTPEPTDPPEPTDVPTSAPP